MRENLSTMNVANSERRPEYDFLKERSEEPIIATEKLCKNCCHWCRGGNSHNPHPPGFGSCFRVDEAREGSIDSRDGFWTLADFGSSLITGPEFGCVHWQKKL